MTLQLEHLCILQGGHFALEGTGSVCQCDMIWMMGDSQCVECDDPVYRCVRVRVRVGVVIIKVRANNTHNVSRIPHRVHSILQSRVIERYDVQVVDFVIG